jgi:hypothetical protein
MSRVNFLFLLAAMLALSGLVLLMMWPGLNEPILEGLDGAHHLMDGLFFYDLLRDLPFSHLIDYTFDYYRHYPALGFVFWPPFFPFIEGITFHLLGTQMQSALLALLVFGIIFTASFWWLSRRLLMSHLWAWAATALLITSSVLLPYWNTVMREIPVLAMMLLWLVCWCRCLDQATMGRWLWVVVVGWLVIYTKQTGALIFIAAGVDVLLSKREVLKRGATWWAAALFILGALPLLMWTLTYGQSNLSQSFGSDTQRIMSDYQGSARWSWQAWHFYVPVMMAMLPKLLWPGCLCSVAMLSDKRYWVWFLWLIGFYLLFSYFDNRDARFAILALPPLLLLSIGGWCWLVGRLKRFHWPVLAILGGVLVNQVVVALEYVPRGERGMGNIVRSLPTQGNVVYLGQYRQLWVYHQCMQDALRQHAVLQGDDLLAATKGWQTLLHDYQVAYVVMEAPADAHQQTQLSQLAKRLPDAQFTLDDHAVKLHLWQYTGPHAVKMADIPLHSHLIE